MRVTHPKIFHLKPNQIFVFGSNLRGLHGAGAARLAEQRFGAVAGQGEGLFGQSYALPTKDTSIETMAFDQIQVGIDSLLDCVKLYDEKEFLITEVGCGLAGLNAYQIAPMFIDFVHEPNITLPFDFWRVLLQEKL